MSLHNVLIEGGGDRVLRTVLRSFPDEPVRTDDKEAAAKAGKTAATGESLFLFPTC